MTKFLVSRSSIIRESWWIEAEDEDAAIKLGYDGEVDNENPYEEEWVEYFGGWEVLDRTDEFIEFITSKPVQ